MKKLLFAACILLNQVASAGPIDPLPPRPIKKTFTNPTFGGGRLDWCQTWATNCGKPAADAFCLDKGYDGSLTFAIDENIGHTVLLTGEHCDGDFCDGFTRITCILEI